MVDFAVVSDLSFALAAGVATFFSPCAYPLLPGYVGFYLGQTDGGASLAGSGVRGITAGMGVLMTFGVLIGTSVLVGRSVLPDVTLLEVLVGSLLIGFGGLVVTGYAPSVSIPLPRRRSNVLGFGIFGAGYALASAGCVAPIFFAITARALSLPTRVAVVFLAVYVGVVATLMIAVTVATGVGVVTNAGRVARHSGKLKRVAGAIMILAGGGQLYLSLIVY